MECLLITGLHSSVYKITQSKLDESRLQISEIVRLWEDPGIQGEMSIGPRLPVHHGKTSRLVSLQSATFRKHFVAILTYELFKSEVD